MITKIKRDTKRMVCLLGMSALFAVNMQAKAAEISEPALEIGPILQSENAAILQPSFSISSSGTANVEVRSMAKGATSKIDVELNLQKYTSSTKKWKTVKTWKKTKMHQICCLQIVISYQQKVLIDANALLYSLRVGKRKLLRKQLVKNSISNIMCCENMG